MQEFHPTSASLGRRGSLYVTDTAAHTGDFAIIQALEATVLAELVSADDHAGSVLMEGTLTNISLPAGISIYGRFSSFTLGSGVVIAYKT